MHAEVLSCTICLPTLVLIAQAVLERGQTDKQTNKQTDATEGRTHARGYTAGVGNNDINTIRHQHPHPHTLLDRSSYDCIQITAHNDIFAAVL